MKGIRSINAILAAALVTALWAAPAQADHRERGGLLGAIIDVFDDDDDHQHDRDRGKHGGKGPAFCRSGAGHPVHGRRWCVNKGFGLGDSNRHRDAGDVLEDVILGY